MPYPRIFLGEGDKIKVSDDQGFCVQFFLHIFLLILYELDKNLEGVQTDALPLDTAVVQPKAMAGSLSFYPF